MVGKAVVKIGGSEPDFDSLPPVFRRKYFSTLERLRLASAGDPTVLSPPPRTVPQRKFRPSLEQRSSTLGRFATRRLRQTLFARETYIAAQVDSQWFLSLPPAIQRKKFTREEQVILAGYQDSVILDAADEKLYKLRRETRISQQSLTSLFSLYDHSIASTDSESDGEESTTADSAVDMDESVYDSFRWLEDDDDLDLSLDDYHTHITQAAAAEQTKPAQPPSRRSSFRRTLSITSLSFGRSSNASNQPPRSSQSSNTVSSFQQSGHKRAFSRPFSTILLPRHDPQNSLKTTVEPAATHYQDPEARLKLRVYLASPQKFDEAVEFGFPSLTKGTTPTTTQTRTFLHDDDGASMLEDDANGGDKDSIDDTNAPNTPVDSAFSYGKTSKDTGLSASNRPRIVTQPVKTYIHSSAGSREMTLRMTLTRPDLRSTGSELKPANNLDTDALRLADLPTPDEANNIWASLPPEKKGMKKILRKLKKRA